MKHLQTAVLAAWHAVATTPGWLYTHPAAVIVGALAICAGLIAASGSRLLAAYHVWQQYRINARNHAAIERERARVQHDRQMELNLRTQELLDDWYPGLTIPTMTPEAYRRVRVTLTAEGLWNV